MRIGISSSCYYPLETEKALRLIGQSGIDTTEIFFNANIELQPSFISELRRIKEHYGISITSIHPTMSLAESFMLFSAYDRRLLEGLDAYKRYGEIAAELGAKYIIMHGGKPNGILSDEGYCERFLEIAKEAKAGGGTLLQENVVNFRAGNLDFLRFMKNYLGEKAAFCLDLKQSIRGGYSPFDAMDILGSSVKHLHLSDSNNDNDCMLPLSGNFDFNRFLKYAKEKGFSGNGIIELYRNAYKEYGELTACLTAFKKCTLVNDR